MEPVIILSHDVAEVIATAAYQLQQDEDNRRRLDTKEKLIAAAIHYLANFAPSYSIPDDEKPRHTSHAKVRYQIHE